LNLFFLATRQDAERTFYQVIGLFKLIWAVYQIGNLDLSVSIHRKRQKSALDELLMAGVRCTMARCSPMAMFSEHSPPAM